ncbi:MAG: hypothetical protein M1531_07070 [Chloroflexi bacterium]|nr:hypothetical protein [Chloroflexota bacterium]
MFSVVVLVLQDIGRVTGIVEAWRKAGASGATILDATGAQACLDRLSRDDCPLLPSLDEIMSGGEALGKLMFTVVPAELVEGLMEATQRITGDLAGPNNGIMFSINLDRVVGVPSRRPGVE